MCVYDEIIYTIFGYDVLKDEKRFENYFLPKVGEGKIISKQTKQHNTNVGLSKTNKLV